jgi:hypothetical protein
MIHGSIVSIATVYGLDNRGVGVRVPVGSRIFSSSCCSDRLCTGGKINDKRKTEALEENPVPGPLCPTKILHI